MNAEICYLLLLPLRSRPPGGKPAPSPAQKDTPYFFDVDIEFVWIDEFQLVAKNIPVHIRCQALDGQVWLAECRYAFNDILSETAPGRNRAIQTELKEQLQARTGYTGAFTETYTALLLTRLNSSPDEFIDRHAGLLVRWLRSLDKPFTKAEAAEILASRTRYSERDMIVIDREGAIIIAEKGDFQFDLELLKIGNYQLLRYRLLDRTIEKHLQQLHQYVNRKLPAWLPSKYKTLRQIVTQRLSLALDFEKIDQSLLLIGDWYSAQVYRLVVEQLFLAEWKSIVQSKIDSLIAMNDIVYQELAFSWRRFLDFVQFAGWLILLVGYFILFFMNLG